MGFVQLLLLLSIVASLAHAGAVGVPLINSYSVLSSTSFSVDIAGSTKGSGPVYQAVSVVRSGVTVYDQVPALAFSTSRTSVTFTSAHLEPQDVIYHTYYTAETGGSVITYAAAVYQAKCLTAPAWSGSDYSTYPFDLGGLGGTTATVYTNVSTYIGAGYTINPANGCWSADALVPGASATPLANVVVTFPSNYMVFTSKSDAATNDTSIPFQPYGQSTHQASAVDIDWGDGTAVETGLVSSTGVTRTHTYAAGATTHTIRISGTAHALCYTALAGTSASGLLVDLQQWGNVVTYQLNLYDELRAGSLVVSATDAPNPSLVNVDRLFAVSVPFYTLAPYAGRVTSFAAWSLPAIVTANDAFPGLNLSTATASGLLASTLTSTNNMFLRSLLPSAVTFIGGGTTLSSSTSMLFGASLPGTFNMTGVACASPAAMFQGATFSGAVTIASSSFASPVGAFGTTPQSTYTYFHASLAFINTTITGDATSLFINAKFTSASSAASFAGLDVTGVTTATTMFANANFTLAPSMDTLSLSGATTVGSATNNGAFLFATNLPNLPALDLSAAVTCTALFSFATFASHFEPAWPLMKCTTATNMFRGTKFTLGTNLTGMNTSQLVTATNMFYGSTANPDVSTWDLGAVTSAGAFLHQAYVSTPARYSQVLIAFSTRSTLNSTAMGSPYNTTSGTTLQGYDSTGVTARADLVARSWALSDGGLMM